jgi:hypothetical protein
MLRQPPALREAARRFGNDQRLAGSRYVCVSYTLLGQKLHQLLDIDIHQVNRRDFAGMGSDAHDKILTDSINDEEAVVVTANRESSGMT